MKRALDPRSAALALWEWDPSTRAVSVLSVLAVTLATAASIVAVAAFARIGPQVQRIDNLQGIQTAQIKRIDELQSSQTALVTASRKQSHQACLRSMKISPVLVNDYRDRHVFERYLGQSAGTKLLAEAIRTIPKTCP